MKKNIILFIASCLIISCEPDDICLTSIPDTPRLIICFFDESSGLKKEVNDLKIQGLENDSHRLPQSVFIQTISGGYATEDEELPTDVYNPTDIDVILRPDYETIRSVPWYEDPTAQVICDAVNLNGTSGINSSRTVLKKILKMYDEFGLEPVVSPEVEFYLVKPNQDSDYPLEVPIGQSGREETGNRPSKMMVPSNNKKIRYNEDRSEYSIINTSIPTLNPAVWDSYNNDTGFIYIDLPYPLMDNDSNSYTFMMYQSP